jgi:hypothetical protein
LFKGIRYKKYYFIISPVDEIIKDFLMYTINNLYKGDFK